MGKFQKGHTKLGGRKPGGSKAQINLRNAILGALEAVNGVEYLTKVARNDPRTFCSLLGRVLPLQIAGDPTNPVRYAVTLSFGQCDDVAFGEKQITGDCLRLEVAGDEVTVDERADEPRPRRIN